MIKKMKKQIKLIFPVLIILVLITACTDNVSTDENVNNKVEEENLHETSADSTQGELETITANVDVNLSGESDLMLENQGNIETKELVEGSEELVEESEELVEESEESIENTFTVEELDKIMYPSLSLNVRTGPSTAYEVIGSLTINQEVHVTGMTENGWKEIDYNGQNGYCSGFYLDSEPIEMSSASPVINTVESVPAEVPTDAPTEIPTEVSTETPVVTASATINELLVAVNADRTANGLATLTLDADLQNTAAVRALEIATLFDHIRPDGSTCFTAFPSNGGTSMAENIYMNSASTTAAAVEAAWMASSGHKANILNATYTKIGIGIYQASNGYWYFVQDFSN